MPASTVHSAQRCIDALNLIEHPQSSPLYTVMTMAHTLESSRQAWVIRGQSRSTRKGNWPTWFARNTGEKPMLYLHSAQSSAQLSALADATQQRGILCNDIENQPSPWPKGTQPSLPLWLTTHPHCTPYDPASGAEARAIVMAGLNALYVQGKPGFYYLALHDQICTVALSEENREDALKGMYAIQRDRTSDVRLLGAGQALAQVIQAAQRLEQEWDVTAQVWSCPSYTRLAREAATAERWNRLHPTAAKRSCHLQDCLAGNATPVIAVTGYAQPIVDQLAGYIDAPFVALGAGSVQASTPSCCWIVVAALRALADEGRLDALHVERALLRYQLK
ncbi:pyruvate dehydrogenase [Pseudomonas sp. HN11]|uniref:transketolase-like TK C-terminal-containing protein n=1 Tax=Pseudomonas sp. HN11 TaxID=1344094 RepID=UPI001F1DCED1|nr:pyruvate dehydrogenase [Pseudomonas sp. HN11]UII69486.1 pyruvate dehydrogenase [Pseudomonas sp. HN11]